MISRRYFVTYADNDGKVISTTNYGISQEENETEQNFLNLKDGQIALRLFEVINHCTCYNCKAIINFWLLKEEHILI